ncbi:MAG: carboxymuconolactone decarboxylase family protein [Chloroflexi bacterium]|nr:carboxymuconolactone decarboxylase family protein [Chloroflexota bacterium]MCI0821350.1 carboxymuconolactone decarboxylase family protein [Chloroflexota bacterium]
MHISEESKEAGRRVRTAISGAPTTRSSSNAAAFDLVPGLEDYVLGSVFGDLWGREQLDVKTRCGLTLAMLAVLGNDPQVRTYVGYALNVGWTPEEIAEIFVHSIPYGGLPPAVNALRIATEVFKERGVS